MYRIVVFDEYSEKLGEFKTEMPMPFVGDEVYVDNDFCIITRTYFDLDNDCIVLTVKEK